MLTTSSKGSESRFSEIHELAEASELLAILECPICKEVPFPPIHHCDRGHIICFNCKSKLVNCPLCKANFSEGRNFPVESIILNSTLKCVYRANGCSVVLKGDAMEKHLKQCTFKGLSCLCHLGRYTSCAHSVELLPIPKYLSHLREGHMMLPNISKSPNLIFESGVLAEVSDTFWLGDYAFYDSKTFVIRQFMRNGLVYFSLGLIGDQQSAKKYLVNVSIASLTDKVSKVNWSIPTHSILCKEEEIMDKFCAVIPFSYIKAHSRLVSPSPNSKSSNKKIKLNFSVEYTLRHCSESQSVS